MKAVEFLTTRGIQFYWVYYYMDDDNNKKWVDWEHDAFLYPDGKRSSQNFRFHTDLIQKQTQYYLQHRDNIEAIASHHDWKVGLMCDTFQVHQLDIDNPEFIPEVRHLFDKLPYYYSVRKNLPHIFFKTDTLLPPDGKTTYEEGALDVLHGTCGLIDPHTDILSADKGFDFDYATFIQDFVPVLPRKLRPLTSIQQGQSPQVYTDSPSPKDVILLLSIVDPSRATDYDTWLKMGLILKSWNPGNDGFSAFQFFSKRSPSSYRENEWQPYGKCFDKWSQLSPNGNLRIGTLFYYARYDNPEQYKMYFGETYDRIKKMFEKTHFKVMFPIRYYEQLEDRLLERTETEMTQTFRNMYCYVLNEDEDTPRRERFIKLWMDDPSIRSYDRIVFRPTLEKNNPRLFNMFQGFEVERRCQRLCYDKTLGARGLEFLQHHLRILSGNDEREKVYQYLVKFIAHLIQKPEHKLGVAIVMKSKQGAGKGCIWDYIGNCLLGSRVFLTTSRPSDIFGDFNALLMNRLLVMYDETSGKDTFMNADELKNKITSGTVSIQEKYKEKQADIPDYSRWIFLSNNLTPVKKEEGDRRYMCIRCSDEKVRDTGYFDTMDKLVDFRNKNTSPCLHTLWAFYTWLQSIDLSCFDPINDRPDTDFNRSMLLYNTPRILSFLYQFSTEHREGVVKVPLENGLYTQYREWFRRFENDRPESCSRFSTLLNDYLEGKECGFIKKTRPRGVNTIQYCRADMERLFPVFAPSGEEEGEEEEQPPLILMDQE